MAIEQSKQFLNYYLANEILPTKRSNRIHLQLQFAYWHPILQVHKGRDPYEHQTKTNLASSTKVCGIKAKQIPRNINK